MTNRQNLERLSGALEHAWQHSYHHSETHPEAQQAFTIALSREAGTPGSAVAHEVGRRLGWPVFDHELLERIAEEMHLRPSLLRQVDERPVNWLVERLGTFMAQPEVSEPAFVEHLIAVLLGLSAHGRCVVVGRGSVHLLSGERTLRVRLAAPLRDRIEAHQHQNGISYEEAAHQVATIDRERTAFAQKHFRADPTDPTHYDLLLNSSRFSLVQLAELIIAALHLRETNVVEHELAALADR